MSLAVKQTLADRIFFGVLYTIMTCISVLLLYPLLWVVMTSLADPVWLSSHQVLLVPSKFSLDAYQFILSDSKLWTSYGYSVYYTAVTLICTLFFCTLLAYPLSLPQFKARKVIGVFILLPMFLSGGMIPEFTIISRYGLLDTVWALALPASASTLYVILMRGNFSQISGELREAALIDGASEFQIFYRIVLPLSKVILVIISLYAIVDSWNNFTSPLLYITEDAKSPLAIYLRSLIITNKTDTLASAGAAFYQSIAAEGGALGMRTAIKMGTIVVSVLPIMCIYPFIQKYFVKGIMLGSVKG